MKLIIYKGFDKDFLRKIEGTPLVDTSIDEKKDVLGFDKKPEKNLRSVYLKSLPKKYGLLTKSIHLYENKLRTL